MGSWARTGRGCTLYSGGCTARGLGPARVEVLLGRRAVGIKKGRERTAKPALHNACLYSLKEYCRLQNTETNQSFQNPQDQLMAKWPLVLTLASKLR